MATFSNSSVLPAYMVFMFITNRLMSIINKFRPWLKYSSPYNKVLTVDVSNGFGFDPESTKIASTDYGKIVQEFPAAVYKPSTVSDIVNIVKFSYISPLPFTIAPRGHGHSIRGQAMARNGVVIDMSSLNNNNNEKDHSSSSRRIKVSWNLGHNYFVDVGSEQLWIDVLCECLKLGLAPVSWTDYLYLSVGGTLSNGGISGQSFRYGPQISNVLEMDVITGTYLSTFLDLFSSVFGITELFVLAKICIVTKLLSCSLTNIFLLKRVYSISF